MSAPNDEGNPWVSLADLLGTNTSVATLATTIETVGIQTYDRFGRRISATDDGPEINVRKSAALNVLASYYAFISGEDRDENFNPDLWFEFDSPLQMFGWPKDEVPNFDKVAAEDLPEALKPKKHNIDTQVGTRTRRTYLTIMAALCQRCGINYQVRGAAQRIKEATEDLGAHIDDDTIQAMLKEIPDALEARMK